MGKVGGFKEITRQLPDERPIGERILDYNEVYLGFSEAKLREQGARCMNCGVPFCNFGCPLGNVIPEFNDLVYKGRFQEAFAVLQRTNNFPEFTGKVCPALCEESCVLNINERPVTIKLVEQKIVEKAFAEGWVKPTPPRMRSGKKVAIIGSGPAGLACAAQLNRAGHLVTVFERADRVGGLLTYGIPNFKLDKGVVERRIELLKAEGITFVTSSNIGVSTSIKELRKNFQAIVLCCGSTLARNLDVPGRELKGIYYAMEYLPQQTKVVLGDRVPEENRISAKDKDVIVLGGGDTGADCLGTAIRQGCASVCQFELLPEPPKERTPDMPWPLWPMILRTSSAHKESEELQKGKDTDWPAKVRDYSINTKAFIGENGVVKAIRAVRLEWVKGADGRHTMKEIPGSEFEMKCDLCLLALGFVHPEHAGPIEELKLEKDARGNIKTDGSFMTNISGLFAAGDARRGQSLVVWAINEGRQAAYHVDAFLMGHSELPLMKS